MSSEGPQAPGRPGDLVRRLRYDPPERDYTWPEFLTTAFTTDGPGGALAELDSRDFIDDIVSASFGRDQHKHAGLGLHPAEGKQRQLSGERGRARRRGLPGFRDGVALNGLQWGAERGPASSPERVRPEALRVGAQVRGQRVRTVADGPTLRVVKPDV